MLIKIIIVVAAFMFLFKRYSKVIIKFLLNVLGKRMVKMQQQGNNPYFNQQQAPQRQPQNDFEKSIKVDDEMTIYIPKKKK
ncbi:hypothetical protein [Flammeovirga kamogawensis]|uniref:DUF4834 family protein n=1 Tax=Flammeovirga kamogawensis TaxID=373891 RepID=A0ABX8GX66_9BACT|nr:hypothetical protein [Flammeovirga kamogawensis]MBB6460825.1 hypothetical protein [Flammeovirga kamogawensis]QWG08176.1 hypothetical protein KM029_04350 [Flammeovirga kamogawensis]TRX69979.1 hypothetical protein EO216_18290 [Flammeovirga kamogawensis]